MYLISVPGDESNETQQRSADVKTIKFAVNSFAHNGIAIFFFIVSFKY